MYDAKIRDVSEGKDKKGKKCFEYLVHFQGWNNSWDRRVSEDFLLKDNADNRKLQRELAEKSQLQLGAYLVSRAKITVFCVFPNFFLRFSIEKKEKSGSG